MKKSYDSLTRLSQQTRQVAEMAKKCFSSQTDVIFVVMNALVRIYEDDLIATAINLKIAMPWAHALGLSCPNQLTCYSVRSRVSSELHSRLAEDGDEVVQLQDECCHLVESNSSSPFFRVFCFMVSSILSPLAFNFAGGLPRKFQKGASGMVTIIGKCQDISVGRIQGSLFWSSKTRPD